MLCVLEETLAEPDVKVVIFSQWLRSHELLSRALDAAGHEYVMFHGGMPGRRRGALVRRLKTDPACRVFLSTDAGGVGLNLQAVAAAARTRASPVGRDDTGSRTEYQRIIWQSGSP